MDGFIHRLRIRCTEKVRHASAADAAREVKRIKKKYKTVRFSYECPLCGGFHLTSSPPPIIEELTLAVKAKLAS